MRPRPKHDGAFPNGYDISTNVIGFDDPKSRERAIEMLAEAGWNHFVCFIDVQAEFALQYGFARWRARHGLDDSVYGPVKHDPKLIYVAR